MNIKVDSPVNKYYVQTLGMIFFPGERFGDNQENDETAPSLYVKTKETETGIDAYAEMSFEGETRYAEYSVENKKIQYYARI